MVAMTVYYRLGLRHWGFVWYFRVLHVWFSRLSPQMSHGVQVSFSSFRILSCEIFEPCIRATSQCQLCVALASSVRTFEKYPNKYHSPFARYVVVFFFCQSNSMMPSGFLFFGQLRISRKLSSKDHLGNTTLFNLVLGFSLVAEVDMSSAETFVQIHRLLAAKRVTLVSCGFAADSPILKALRSV